MLWSLVSHFIFVVVGILSVPYLSVLFPYVADQSSLHPVAKTNVTAHYSPPVAHNMAAKFLDFVKARRTFYPLSKDISVPKERIEDIVKQAVLHTPSSFNSQSNRAVILFGGEHDKYWDIAREVLKPIVPAETWGQTSGKMDMFKGAAGTILFFEDQEVVQGFQKNIPAYAHKFPLWSVQSLAMVQFVCWTALEAEGLGCNLQHYDPLVDEKVAEEWKTPKNWKLNAQMVFGARTSEPGEKVFKPVEDNVKVYSS